MGVACAIKSQPVDMRRLEIVGAVAAYVPDAEFVREDEDDVGLPRRLTP
jgi:hypothetical protein